MWHSTQLNKPPEAFCASFAKHPTVSKLNLIFKVSHELGPYHQHQSKTLSEQHAVLNNWP